jgi:hypothetical protein
VIRPIKPMIIGMTLDCMIFYKNKTDLTHAFAGGDSPSSRCISLNRQRETTLSVQVLARRGFGTESE